MGYRTFYDGYIAPSDEPDIDFLLRELSFQLLVARKKRHLNQATLAEMVGTSQHIISRAESGKGNPSLKTLLKISHALNVRLTLVE